MSVAVFTSVSANNSGIASLTVPNKLEYCLRHGYSLIADNQPYEVAVARTDLLCHYLDRFDLVFTLDADAVITDMTRPIDGLACIGPHVTACEEGIVPWNRLNCGAMVWRNTTQARALASAIAASRDEWRWLSCGWQTWLADKAATLGDTLTVAPLRSFNSCVWNRPGNERHDPGGHWQPGDLVYHPCGVYPLEERAEWIGRALQQVQR